jgi:transcriptional regulator with XRE-family HTH domain
VSPAPLVLVPPRRLGALLRDERAARGRTVDEVASASAFSATDLIAVESGDRDLTDAELTALLGAYGVTADDLVPERAKLVVDLDEHVLSAGGEARTLAGEAPTADQVLASYLSLVYTLRHATPGSPIVLRDADIEVLARALDLARASVTERLHALMIDPDGEVHHRSRLLRGRVLVPLAGIVVAATTIGALVLVQGDDPETITTEPAAAEGTPLEPSFTITNPDGSTTPVYVGDGLRPEDLPPGAVGLAPATQEYPDGVTVVNGEGQPVPVDLPENEVWVGEPQVAEQDDSGNVTQSTREP